MDPKPPDTSPLERLRREIQIGIDQIDRSEVFDADEVFDELLAGLP